MINLKHQLEQLASYRHLLSYNDSYFGEPPGKLKSIIADIDRELLSSPRKQAAEQVKTNPNELNIELTEDFSVIVRCTPLNVGGTQCNSVSMLTQWDGARDPESLQHQFTVMLNKEQTKQLIAHLLKFV